MAVRLHANEEERRLVRIALEIVTKTSAEYAALMPTTRGWRPLAFFGPIASAEVVTFGLNPSTDEFAASRNWHSVSDDALADELVNYWSTAARTAHPWFRPWQTVLSGLAVSYASNAAHIDLSPRATNSRKGELKLQFVNMLREDAQVWIEALRTASKCRLVLAAGAATNTHYINEFISEMLMDTGVRLIGPWRRNGEGATTFQTLRLPDGRGIPFFFCSTGPKPKNGSVLVNACNSNISALKRLISKP